MGESVKSLEAVRTFVAERLGRRPREAEGSGAVDELAGRAEGTARILADWQAGPTLQAAGFLQPFVCHGLLDSSLVARHCASRVAELCVAQKCLLPGTLGSGPPAGTERRRGHPLVLARIRAYCAAYQDFDLAFLHAAVLWQRYTAARAAPASRHGVYRDEGRLLLGPYLDMLGMRQLRAELTAWLAVRREASLQRLEQQSHELFRVLADQLLEYLPAAQLFHNVHTQFRLSGFTTDGQIEPQHVEPLNVDVVVEDEAACYQALYRIHRLWQPVEGSLADHLNVSRINGLRFLQTTVMAQMGNRAESSSPAPGAALRPLGRVRVNFRICTHLMDEINRWGLAAFVLRHRLQPDPGDCWWQHVNQGRIQIESATPGSLPETVYVFSPHGELFRFQRGCTVVDYAYHVHSELADRCVRFYVNGEVAEPTTVLHHLDLVELERDARAPGPTQVWLNAARTSRARSRIERFLKRQGRSVYEGQQILNKRRGDLEDHFGFNLPEHRLRQAIAHNMDRYRLGRAEELFAEIAAGRLVADRILHPLFADEVIRQIQLPRNLRLRPYQLHLAQCCRPRPGDDVVGLPYRRHGAVVGLRIHLRYCDRLSQSGADLDETLPLKWRLQPELKKIAQFDITALNEDRLLGDVVSQIYAMLPQVTLHKVEAEARHGIAHLRLSVEAASQEVLDGITRALRELPAHKVDSVRQMELPPTEQEVILAVGASSRHNPYSRLPVREREMFFGRSQDLAHIYEWLQAGAGSIWLRGQKRVGKTSLLLHLKRYYLEGQGLVPVYVDFQLLGQTDDSGILYEVANAVYSDLHHDARGIETRLGDLGAPLRELFTHDPQYQFVTYLRHVQSRLGVRRLVLLLDEFSRTIDLFQTGRLDQGFFTRWRGMMLATMPDVSYVTAVQEKTYDLLAEQEAAREQEPIWELLELGEQLTLRPLNRQDVYRLIEWPIRNFLEYPADMVDYVARLTGGSPFLIQAFCFKLVAHMTRLGRHRVTEQDVESVRQEFLLPEENLFAHLTDLTHGLGHLVTQQMARLAGDAAVDDVNWRQLRRALPNVREAGLRQTLQRLVERDILIQTGEDRWQFASLLFQQWLALNVPPREALS